MSRISDLVSAANDLEFEDVPVTLWGVTIRIKSMDAGHRGLYLERLIKAREEEDDVLLSQIQADLVIECCFDPEDGSKCFSDADAAMLLTKHGGVVGMLSTKASKLSGLDKDAEERLGKGSLVSTATPSVDSTLTSPSN